MPHDTSHAGNGLPGLRGTEHIGFTVPDLDQAIRFFVEVIGCEPFYELGPFQSDGDWMETHLNVHPRTVMKRLKFLRCRHGSNFEIFEYSAPDQDGTQLSAVRTQYRWGVAVPVARARVGIRPGRGQSSTLMRSPASCTTQRPEGSRQ